MTIGIGLGILALVVGTSIIWVITSPKTTKKVYDTAYAWSEADKMFSESSHDCFDPIVTSVYRLQVALLQSNVALTDLQELKVEMGKSSDPEMVRLKFLSSSNNHSFYGQILERFNVPLLVELQKAAKSFLLENDEKPLDKWSRAIVKIESMSATILENFKEIEVLYSMFDQGSSETVSVS